MAILKTILTIVFIIICVALTVIILLQEGKSAGLGSLSGQSLDSYWSRNKGRSKEGILIKITTAMVVLFFILAAVLNIGSF
ncbi:MAG: preprotein translocase subunit SecG [Lachnospiraceae bacterium]|jgi:preprotein translocase subunit SecG|nr:preprotein translocase subunit SecG [Lachnospiraceae bacterium]MBQ1608033.1 preprotein translocase subunit SecG [Lachnospiraceae bacterium]MBQ2466819.1 preprotein translocase subunit SecG [Lachnospiraceae bacterium]MBQ2504545.1 preprotein translocase subunit SecG [Lachnospiraceae bacterium]MBQ5387008.1 preprotein translocase subunit SecG [Lachnospiraceae bacterium]